MISRSQIVLVLAGAVLLLAMGPAAGQDATPPPGGPVIENPSPEGGDGGSDQSGNGAGDQGQDKDKDGNRSVAPSSGSPFDRWLIPMMIGAVILMFFMSSRGKKKQAKKRQEMLASLKKGAKITTIGGIVGTVMEVREDEIVVKVDEQNNVRMRFVRRAIQGVGEDAKKEIGEDSK